MLLLFFQGSIHASSSFVSPGRLILRAAPVFDISVRFLVTGWFFYRAILPRVFRKTRVFQTNFFLLLLSKTLFALRVPKVRMGSLISQVALAARRPSHPG
jgi:hypothetical protein